MCDLSWRSFEKQYKKKNFSNYESISTYVLHYKIVNNLIQHQALSITRFISSDIAE